MSTHIKGSANIGVDFTVDEDLDELEAETAFNEALEEIYRGGSDKGFAEYDQEHTFHVEEEDE